MGYNRYNKYTMIQPVRKITPSYTDIEHVLTAHETIDQLALKYYNDATLEYVIMCANPEYFMSFDIPVGTKLIIPFPLTRVFDLWGEQQDI